ncbi:MAG: hypothetical protein D6731_10005 [Planctomycetota bacterium]|nr:MAG: hypothetical protein D6731_10005 [Planctomycetota bacterium]
MSGPRPRISFGKIAYRVGAVDAEQLARARAERDARGGEATLEEVLIEQGALSEEMAALVREAFLRACAVCPDCGRRTDIEERDPSDFACRCGGSFVPLAETESDPQAIDPAFLQSEEGPVSDAGPVDAEP